MKKLLEKLGRFLNVVGKSCYDMEFYREVRTRPTAKALAYLAKFIVFLAVAGVLFFGPAAFRAVGEARQWIGKNLPDGASFQVADGVFSTGLPVPYKIGDGDALVIDPGVLGGAFPTEAYPKARVIIGRDAIFFRGDDVELRTYLLKETPDISLTKERSLVWLDKYGTAVVAGALLLVAVLEAAVAFVGLAIYALTLALLALFAGRIWKIGLRYGQWLAVAFHAVTLPTLADIFIGSLGGRIPFSFSVLFVLFIGAVIADERSNPVAAAAPPPPPPPADTPPPTPTKPKRTRKIVKK
jgi:hypothetical protein